MNDSIKKYLNVFLVIAVLISVTSCGYRYYMGLHGPSIRKYPDIHEAATTDAECLQCHHPDYAEGPPTSHPNFTGCLKCHNDQPAADG